MKLAADANVLLSALIGGQAMRVLRHQAIEEILTTEATLAEVLSRDSGPAPSQMVLCYSATR